MKTNQTKPSGTSTFKVECWMLNFLPTSIFHLASSILSFLLSTFCFLLFLTPASAATRYVWQESPSPAPPYDTWATAATNIQDAVDAANPGDTVLVTNGVYATGGRPAGTNVLVNRVAVDKPLNLLSVNGPEATIIQGYQVPGTTNGDGAIRCVYLTNGASLSGFTLTNGATRSTGDQTHERSGGGLLCESTNAAVTNCTLTGNSAYRGGGAYSGSLNFCILSGNTAQQGRSPSGGAAWGCILNNCRLTGNSAKLSGGGAENCTLNNCVLAGNSARSGLLFHDSPDWPITEVGGAARDSTLNNCTVTGNYATGGGGGTWNCTLNNCILYFNTAGEGQNYGGGELNYCCTTPLPTNGVGNISTDPQRADISHLSSGSPCIGAGSPGYAYGTDIDGEGWGIPPSIGCDEYHAGAVTGPLSVSITANYAMVATGFPVQLTALIGGRTTGSVWDLGAALTATNRPQVSRAWSSPGDYEVTLRAYNESDPDGVTGSIIVHVVAPVHHVSLDSTNPASPYSSWETAATNIQDAVDAATIPGVLILVTNGLYATGGRDAVSTQTRVVVDKPVVVQSVNGPAFTTIRGQLFTRCVYLGSGARLSGFTIFGGESCFCGVAPYDCGAGVWCERLAVVSECVINNNWAGWSGGGAYGGTLERCILLGNDANVEGGGAYQSTLNHCTISGNTGRNSGGGADSCTLNYCVLTKNRAFGGGGVGDSVLNNCTLTGNSADYFGGAIRSTLNNCTLVGNSAQIRGGGASAYSTLNNCIVYYNTAPDQPNYETYGANGVLNFCCTTPMPTDGVGNIDLDPLFVDTNGWTNLRLQSNSPCINAGNNAYVTSPTDLDGNPRIVSGTVDIGAYEYQGPGSVISYAWLQQYGLPTDGSADTLDADLDGHNTWQEWKAWTDPTNALSVLKLLPPQPKTHGMLVLWQSVLGQSYSVVRATNANGPFSLLQGNVPGLSGTTSVSDTNPANGNPILYRVAVP